MIAMIEIGPNLVVAIVASAAIAGITFMVWLGMR